MAIFDPVELAGTTVGRASLHNISIMKELNIKIGSDITVIKANEIIPQVVECDSDKPDFEVPGCCPVCGGKTQIVKENNTEVLMCVNDNCKGKLLGKLTHFVSKNAIGIYADQMMKLDGFGKQSVNKLMVAIDSSRHTKLERFIYSLSIPNIGRTASKAISKYYDGDFDKFIEDTEFMDWTKLDDFGSTMDYELNNYFLNHKDEVRKLSEYFTFEKQNKTVDTETPDLSGRTFVITGSLEHFANRDELKERIESMNGKVSGSVSAKTTYLINNDLNRNSGKNAKARQLGVLIISEVDFLKMIES